MKRVMEVELSVYENRKPEGIKLALPKGFRILGCGVNFHSTPVAFILVDDEAEVGSSITFKIVQSGRPFDGGEYAGTVVISHDFLHVFYKAE
jgi:hypothetical protein